MSTLLSEIRHACRSLWAQPAWLIAALLCLAIGTGANTAAFSLINGVLLRPLPFENPQQIVMIAIKGGPVSLQQFREMEGTKDLFQGLVVRTFLPVGIAWQGPARMVQSEFVSPEYFQSLRLRPLAGRLFGSEEEIVLSERLWRTHFNGDFSIVGKTIRVNGRPMAIGGIAPAGFVGAMRIIAADMWVPTSLYGSFAAMEAPKEAEGRQVFGLIGRLKDGVSLARTKDQLGALLERQWNDRPTGPLVLMEEATGFGVPPGVRPMVVGGSLLLFGLMGLLITVAIVNVAGLMLARATGRQKEIAVRLALGASRMQIVRQVLVESAVLALAGTLLGAAFTFALPALLRGLGPSLPEHLSYAIDIAPDWRTGLYAGISALGIALLFGLAPARQAAGTNSNLTLRESSGNSRTKTTSRTLNAFVMGQVAISTVLLVIAILLGRTYLNTQGVDPGIDIRNTLAVSLDWSQSGMDRERGRAFFNQLVTRVASIPGVERASLTRQAPLSPGGVNASVSSEGSAAVNAGSIVVTPGYFETVRLPLVQGRDFAPLDQGKPEVAIVNQTMAQRLWADGNPLGRVFSVAGKPGRRLEVIGVAKDAKYGSLSEKPKSVFYEPFSQTYSGQMTLLVRSNLDARVLVETIRREVRQQNADLAAITIRTLEDQFREAAAPSAQRAMILAGTCGIGLLLSAFGLFGVMSYGVRRRVREMGVRMAIGARPSDIGMMVLRQALQLVGIGVAIGLVLAFGVTRIVSSVLFGVTAHDPVTLALVVVLLALVAAAAAYMPARWAMRVDPMRSIRAE